MTEDGSTSPTCSCARCRARKTRRTLAGSTGADAGGRRRATDADAPIRAGLGEQLEEVERAAIMKALEAARYNKTAAAKALGMTFRALRYSIKKLGIE